MFDTDPAVLDADATLTDVVAARAVAEAAEVRILCDAAHWADLHHHLDHTGGVSLPGMEQLVCFGGDGTPVVAEFAPAELGAVLAMSTNSAAMLIGDALDLRHRLPRLWARIQAGEVRAWVGRRTAQATRSLSQQVVAVVDRKVSKWAHSVSWGRLQAIIDAAVIEADPDGAAEAVEREQRSQGVWLGRSNEHGIKDIWIRTETPAAIWFDASVDRAADILGLLGDTSTKDVRRAKAVGILAQPQQALDLFDQGTQFTTTTTDPAGKAADGAETRQSGQSPFGRPGVDPRPPVTLYIHLGEESLTRDEGGVARFEGEGPVTIEQVRRWLGHCRVTVKPVIDLANQVPVDGYEVPERLREAAYLRSPVDVFPYATNTGRRKDADHTIPYVSPDDGGPPGQTAVDKLGLMMRRSHRTKTHGRWQVRQVFNGVFVWRSPHGHLFLVDHTGTHPIPSAPEAA
ncbi:MAG: DUF222 domain-containing protein [Nocardioidaceae bacterium]